MESKKEELMVLTDLIKVLVTGQETGNQYAIFEEQVPPLGGPPPHTHPDEEVFYIVEGTFEFILNDLQNRSAAHPGSVVHVPSMALHAFKNVGNTPGKMVVVLSPGDLLDYFRAVGKPLVGDAARPDLRQVPDFSKIDISKAFEHAEAHQIGFVLPEVIKP